MDPSFPCTHHGCPSAGLYADRADGQAYCAKHAPRLCALRALYRRRALLWQAQVWTFSVIEIVSLLGLGYFFAKVAG